MKKLQLSRRDVLRGAFGTAIGLPLLECMLDVNGVAYANGSPLPCRYFLAQCPTSLVTSGSRVEGMTPTRAGRNYDVRPVLQPLATRGVVDDVSVISGLFIAPLNVPGGYNKDHHGQAPFSVLSGMRSGFSGTLWRPQGWSADQLVARHFGTVTRFPFLYYQVDSQTGGTYACFEQTTGFSGEARIVYRAIQPQVSPLLAYRQLFTGFTPPNAMPDPQAVLDLRLRQSSLSYAGDRIRALQAKLGATDKQTLEEHLTRLRALENRLAMTMPPVVSPACRDPGAPRDPPDVSPSVPDQTARASLFVDLIELAFACDMTRVITLGGASVMTGSGMRHPQWMTVGGLHGELQHTSTQANLDAANRWFVDVYAQVIARFKRTAEGAGTVLDRTAALFVMEGGKGLTSDPQRSGDGGGDPNHSLDNAVMLLGGRAGGLRPGQHLNLTGQDRHHGVIFNSAFRALGVPGQLGEVTGTVDALFT
jgi:hypothetical protein